jgi:hypothetical protein
MKRMEWFDRRFQFGSTAAMLPFFIERLHGTLVRLERKIERQPEILLATKLDGKWSIKENIGHLAEVDEIANLRIEEMLNGVSPLSPAVFEPKGDYNRQSAAEVFSYFKKNRLENLSRYSSLSESQLLKSSMHPRLKISMNPVDLAFFDAEHDDHHLVRINEIQTKLSGARFYESTP